MSRADQRDAMKLLELSRELARERERAEFLSSYSTARKDTKLVTVPEHVPAVPIDSPSTVDFECIPPWIAGVG